MSGIVVLFVVGLIASIVVGVVVAWALDRSAAPRRRRVPRLVDVLRAQRASSARDLGGLATFLLTVSAAIPPMVFVVWVIGMAALRPQIWPGVERMFSWFEREADVAWITSVSRAATDTAEWTPTFAIAGVGAIALASIAPRARWLPPLLVLSAVVAERYLQKVITVLVNAPPPPTSLGVYPSGGAARVIGVYGFIVFLFLRLRPGLPGPLRLALWGAVGAWAFVVGYARAYLLLHWPIDILGGWLFGALLLATLIAATNAFERSLPAAFASRSPRRRLRSAVTNRDRDTFGG